MTNKNGRVVREIPVMIRGNFTPVVKKLNVTYYARVSTENPEQEDSYERQKEHYTQKILANPNWNFVEGYADWGVTGTRADARENFMRMIEDCRAGKIDRILVKSVSRFARNTVDTLNYIRELKDLGISIYFETQNIDTLTPGGEMLITILAAMAEQESRTMSSNIKWSFQKRFKDGVVLINYRHTLGYTKKGDEYVIVESEADIVRRIFREYLSGMTLREIASRLNQEGIATKRGGKWQPSSIEGVLSNFKYTGNAILGMSYKPDVLSKRRMKNEGQAPMYYVENSHPAIISKETYEMTQLERKRRAELRSSVQTGAGKYSSKYAYSSLLICGECGGKMRRFGRRLASREYVPTWVCVTHQTSTSQCAMHPVKESFIDSAYEKAVERLLGDVRTIMGKVRKNIEEVVGVRQDADMQPIEEQIGDIQERIHELFKKKRTGEITPQEYDARFEELSNSYHELKNQQDALQSIHTQSELTEKRLDEILAVLEGEQVDYRSPAIKRLLLEHIKVIGPAEFEFQFKCGVNITETP